MNEREVRKVATSIIGFCQRVRVECIPEHQFVPLEVAEMWAEQLKDAALMERERGAGWADIGLVVQSLQSGSSPPYARSRARGKRQHG